MRGCSQALHERLGEPITDDEAVSAIRSMTADESHQVTFDAFVKYWDREHFEYAALLSREFQQFDGM